MPTLRLSLGLLLITGLTACSQSFWDRPRVAGQVQPSPYAAAPAPQAQAAPPTRTLPPPQVRPSQAPMARSGSTRAEEQQVLQYVNQIRRSQGLRALAYDEALHACARAHSEEQCRCGFMGHESPDPSRRTLVQRMHLAGYQGQMYGEVVAWGYDDAQSVVEGWMNSPEHRAILIDGEMTEAAFSRVGQYWTGNFGTPRIAPPARYGPPATPSRSTYAPSASPSPYTRSLPAPTVQPPAPSRTYTTPPAPSRTYAAPSAQPAQPRPPVQQYFAPVQPAPRPAPRYRPPARGG